MTQERQNEVIKLGLDVYRKRGTAMQYSQNDANQALYEALIEANNGRKEFDIRAIRDGKCGPLFTIMEQIIANTIPTDLMEDEFFMTMVETRNLAEGDSQEFILENDELFTVSEGAHGVQNIHRQRISGSQRITIPTTPHYVKIYDELRRMLSGTVDIGNIINRVARSYRQNVLQGIYALWAGISAADTGDHGYFPAAGSYSESGLMDTINRVEEITGKPAIVVGTKMALSKITTAVQSDKAKDDLYNMGFYGRFNGTNLVQMVHRKQPGTVDQNLNSTLYIVSGDERPIKFVYEGNPYIGYGNPSDKQDLTQEYLYSDNYGMGFVFQNSAIAKMVLT